ncbi:translational machinery component [Hypoxylon sp. FL1150]|nr:translational machinery component [Hypoxylon sp. FL1150]
MSRSSNRLLATARTHVSVPQLACQPIRSLSQTCRRQADLRRPASLLDRLPRTRQTQPAGPPQPGVKNTGMEHLQRILVSQTLGRARNQPTSSDLMEGENQEDWGPAHEPFHFHIYAHKHNAHITVTMPNRNAIINMSTGNIGFKKAKRGTYDAAYQLTAYIIDKLHQGNWHKKIGKMEVVLRGFGAGREAATKVLLGSEGRMLRDKIVKVSDATRLKFGGTRSPKPRRLG